MVSRALLNKEQWATSADLGATDTSGGRRVGRNTLFTSRTLRVSSCPWRRTRWVSGIFLRLHKDWLTLFVSDIIVYLSVVLNILVLPNCVVTLLLLLLCCYLKSPPCRSPSDSARYRPSSRDARQSMSRSQWCPPPPTEGETHRTLSV